MTRATTVRLRRLRKKYFSLRPGTEYMLRQIQDYARYARIIPYHVIVRGHAKVVFKTLADNNLVVRRGSEIVLTPAGRDYPL